ncbi:helix-turn-helix domain-containing protein [Leifsonia sp. F6_8S_P_1B]|uniref:Helix-turn-helix domain-containing protein n=1 Tax=Leifsonia williamsii TaxID=3035919 RepID=A0ABT8KG74_9MICO|nr:helix-turn-helix domain-containing protein [Leifsonia williamsii]MDN4616450.1 helix-turn-helix domain-containing protein [Leifsonia williamsii]
MTKDEAPAVGKKAYTVNEVAAMTGYGRSFIYDQIKAGALIPTSPKGSTRKRFTEKEIDRWIKSWEVTPTSKA